MRQARLDEMLKGWFVGGFEPSVMHSRECEVAVKHYAIGEREGLHHHLIATEVTLVVTGEVEMMGRLWRAGDIVVVEPGEATAFRACTDACCVVVKQPSAAGDKYWGAAEPAVAISFGGTFD